MRNPSPEFVAQLTLLPVTPPALTPAAYTRAALYARQERILVAPRRSGKTTVAAREESGPLFPQEPTSEPYLGIIDDNDGDPVRIFKLCAAANKFQRDQKYFAPNYRWTALIRDTTWPFVDGRVKYMGAIAGQFGFDPSDFWGWMPPGAEQELGPEWLQWFRDAHGRFMPELAYLTARRLPHAKGSIMLAKRLACSEWVQLQKDLCAPLVWMAPDDRLFWKYSRSLITPRARALARLSQFSRQVQPLEELIGAHQGKHSFCERAMAAGVWTEKRGGNYTWAAPWALGATVVKRLLTGDSLRQMI